jgi:hypothetical protein
MSNKVKYIVIGVFVVALGIAWAVAAKLEGKEVGAACEANRNDCIGGDCLLPKGGSGYCSVPCQQSSECPKGWSCESVSVDTYSGKTGEKVKQDSTKMCIKP